MWYHRDPYGRRRDPYYDRSYRLIAYLIPLLHEAQRHLTVARTPVTLALLAVQVALHYRGALLPGLELLPNFALRDVCILPARWWELRRLALAPLLHVDDVHLYYNMMSAISKGAALEPVLGPERFGCLVVGLGLAAGVIHVALAFALRALSPAVFGDEVRPLRGCLPAVTRALTSSAFPPALHLRRGLQRRAFRAQSGVHLERARHRRSGVRHPPAGASFRRTLPRHCAAASRSAARVARRCAGCAGVSCSGSSSFRQT